MWHVARRRDERMKKKKEGSETGRGEMSRIEKFEVNELHLTSTELFFFALSRVI